MNFYATVAVAVFVYMTIWFFVSLLQKRNDVADTAWGLGFILAAWTSFFISPHGVHWVALTVTVAVTLWGLRLSFHIHERNHSKPEDARYALWRKTWGKWFVLRSYVQVFLLQGMLLFLVALPVISLNLAPLPRWSPWYGVGLLVWVTGFLFETFADRQLATFLSDTANRGKIMDRGLWRYSRHPNYFGEVMLWWGIYGIAAAGGQWWTILGPLTITILILFVSGVPLLEKQFSGNPDFESYKKRTSIFFPFPPKKSEGEGELEVSKI